MAAMKREAIREFFRRLHDANPNPQTELEYASPYQLLVAVVLSAQATDRSVNLATRKLFALPDDTREYIEQSASVVCYDIVRSVCSGFVFQSAQKEILAILAAGTLNAEIRLVLSDVADAKILDRAKRHGTVAGDQHPVVILPVEVFISLFGDLIAFLQCFDIDLNQQWFDEVSQHILRAIQRLPE